MTTILRRLVMLSLVVLIACGDDPPAKAADELTYELFPSTRVLREAELSTLTSAGDDGTLVFAQEPEALRDLQVGQVILAGQSEATPAGLLRVVGAIERSNGGLTLRTAAAPIQVAFRKLHARVRRNVDLADGELRTVSGGIASVRSQLVGGSGSTARQYDFVVFDGDGDESTTNDQVKIDTTLGGAYAYDLSVDVDWGDITDLPGAVTDCLASVANVLVGDPPSCAIEDLLPEVKSTFAVEPSLTADLTARGAAVLDFEREFHVGTVHLVPYPLGPLVFVPSVDVIGSVRGGASARFELGASARVDLESSVTLSSRTGGTPQFSPPRLKDHEVDVRPPTIDLHAFAEAQAGARLNVSLYGVAGPYATASAVARIDATPLEDPCWRVNLALEADLGARITSPNLPLLGYVTLVDWRTQPFRPFDAEVANGTCVVPADPPLPPGSGPTAQTYQAPPFEPWAAVLGGAVEGPLPPAVGSFALGSPSLVPSIDGRWVASSAFAHGLHKIAGDGTLTWASSYVWESDRPLRVLRAVPTHDAGMLVLLVPQDDVAFVLARTTQSGALVNARAYELPEGCVPDPTELTRDAGKGFVVLGRCRNMDGGWIVHLDGTGDVLTARTIQDPAARQMVPLAAVASGGDVVVTGWLQNAEAPDWAFVTRLDANDRPGVSTAFTCPELLTIQPTSIAPSEDGGVTVVGTANGTGLVARVRRDGALGFARFPHLGMGVADGFVVSSVAELPTTGMLVAASTGNAASGDSSGVAVAGLDGGGRTLWARRYTVPERELVWPALRLTDDGGAIVAAIAGPAGERAGDLVAIKVFAKDGGLGDAGAVASEAVVLADFVCAVSTRSLAPQVTDIAITARSIALTRN